MADKKKCILNYAPYGGYHVKNLASLDERYKCPVCKLIIKNGVQLICGDRICRLCVPHIKCSDVQCPEYSQTTLVSQIVDDKGFNNDIQTLAITCSSCEWSGELKNYQNHLEQIHNHYQCSYCNETFSSSTIFNQHQETTCSQMPVNCILHKYGCEEKILRCDLSKHYLTETHQRILLLYILQVLINISDRSQPLTQLDTNVERTTIDLLTNINTIATTTLKADKYNVQQEGIKEMISIMSNGIESLNDDSQILSDELLQQSLLVEAIHQRLEILKTSCEESNAILHAHTMNMDILQQECRSLKQTVSENESISYDGTFIWKITDVKEKMIDAESERQPSIYSPPFYSSPTGYKMCARLYMHGDGNARRTHMSLFFVLMRGSNDTVLHFPFKYKVTFCLFDQTGQQNHIIDSFRPDIKSSSFQRPQSNMNIASGIPKFVPLAVIEQNDNPYVKLDTMFIKIMVDFEDLPKAILPYALSLNPGLPTECQHKMIRQEIERQAQLQSKTTSETNLTKKKEIIHGSSKKDG
ncbi:unnamed protein product [Adineta steineri]|uniref:Uncharacterized protein n=1 Tax=Adineta steineri TaxID=433720 RepID=A0A813Z2H9_9BILA|nr:unnamed protein product [Adineta steineri]CAF0893375.1 unnamed protein product [Adineta steineri]